MQLDPRTQKRCVCCPRPPPTPTPTATRRPSASTATTPLAPYARSPHCASALWVLRSSAHLSPR
eukprot:842824-Prymnesium_polylepis.1